MVLLSLLLATAVPCTPQREAATLHLADFDSAAEVVTPPAGTALRGYAVLFAESDVADKDGAIVGANGTIAARPMRAVADRIACAGYASVRYNKRYVTGPSTADRAKFDELSGADLAADGQAALAFARTRPAFVGLPAVLVGWSQGTTVAMAVAEAEPDVRALVLLAPVIDSPARTVQAHYRRVGRPYLARYATDGALDAAAIARAGRGAGGPLAQVFVRMFRGFAPGDTINPLLDTDKNGYIQFTEADPIIASWYADTPNGGLGMDVTGRALRGVADAYTSRTPPMLILQGLNDANVDPVMALAFADRPDSRGRVALLTYRGLGHALGPAPSMVEDQLLSPADKPLGAIGPWLDGVLARRER